MKSTAPALERGINVMELLASEDVPQSFSAILAALNIPRASLVRILNTLHKRGMIERIEESGHYRLGLKLLYLGHRLLEKTELRSVAWSFMQQLSKLFGETVELSTLDRDQLVLIEQIEGPGEVRVYSRVGAAYPYFHAVSVGKIYLAHMEPPRRRHILDKVGLPGVTNWTITNHDEIDREIRSVRERGYAVEDQELRKGVRRVAAPIYDHNGRVAGCLSVAAPIFRMEVEDFPKIGEKVKEMAGEVSLALGGRNVAPRADMILG